MSARRVEALLAVDGEQADRRESARLALQRQWLERVDLGGVAGQPICLVTDQDLARLRRLLEASGDVDGIARCEPLLGSGHDLARRDADAALDPELGEGLAHLDRGAQRAQRVVLVQHRDAEDGHDCVADELLDRAAVALDDRLHALEVAREQRPQCLRVERLAELGRAGDVAEEHGHRLALLAGLLRHGEGRSASVTEASALAVLGAALTGRSAWVESRRPPARA